MIPQVVKSIEPYWTLINLAILGFIIWQLRKLKKKSSHIESENVTTATLVARAEAQRVVDEAKRVAEEAKRVAEKAAQDLKRVAKAVANSLNGEDDK